MNGRLSSRVAYDNTGQHYNLTRITQADGTINLVAFKEYSPLYLSCVSTYLQHIQTHTHALRLRIA